MDKIRSTVELIIKLKDENQSKSHSKADLSINNLSNNPYEEMVQKLKEEIRNHIRIEQQQKIQFETAALQIEELENEKKKMTKKNQVLSLV